MEQIQQERWSDIEGYEGLYKISSAGRIMSFAQSANGRILKPKISRGYEQIALYRNGRYKTMAVHRLVAEAFIPNPENLPQVNHKDELRTHNQIDNLEWCTSEQNINYGNRNLLVSKANKNNYGRPVLVTDSLGNERIFGSSSAAIRSLGLKQQSVSACIHGGQKTHRGFQFRYA